MYTVETYVKSRARLHHARVLSSLTGAYLLRERVLGIDSVAKAATATGTTRAAIKAALTIEDDDLVARVLDGEPLGRAARTARARNHPVPFAAVTKINLHAQG